MREWKLSEATPSFNQYIINHMNCVHACMRHYKSIAIYFIYFFSFLHSAYIFLFFLISNASFPSLLTHSPNVIIYIETYTFLCTWCCYILLFSLKLSLCQWTESFQCISHKCERNLTDFACPVFKWYNRLNYFRFSDQINITTRNMLVLLLL